ncbi:MAG TPA: PQQ-binding-like beta-propeller repeat protein [Phycisphaerae bacterium]|nr:PQQ-binding-like beta-propeller repeat protein [Phycisphaerae bacterium]HRW55614.1 PQQ-binding-like beta-propeller repeat protein [Phycisphaerae bacterium]
MARSKKSLLYIGTHRYVAAIDPATGEELWRTKLPHGGFSVPSILIKGPFLYVGHAGYAYCLSRRYGEIVWENGLKGLGYQTVVMAMEGAEGTSSHVAAAVAQNQQQAAAAASAGA